MAWWPAACTQHHTARGLTTPPPYHPSSRAAVAHGPKTARAQPRHWSSLLVRCCGCTPRASSKGATCGMVQPCGQRPTRRCHRIVPTTPVIWRVAQPLLRTDAPHAGQGGQAVGGRARSSSTIATNGTARTRATCHAARIRAVREPASSSTRKRYCTDGSSSRMLSIRHSIEHRPPLEPLARDSKSVPDFRCYARPPPTAICAHWDLIRQQYEEMIKFATALRLATAEPEAILRRFTRNNLQHPTYQTLAEMGKAVKTIFLCRYLDAESLRQEINEGLNVVENWNSANGFIFYGKGGEIATNRLEDQEIAVLSLHLLQACWVYINTLMIQQVLESPSWFEKMEPEDFRGLSSLIYHHINPYGVFELNRRERLPIEMQAAA